MTPLYEQPMIKLLQILSPTISWLDSKGSVEVAEVPSDHMDAIKQLERIGIVHKRNNRCYELQKIRLKKLMGSIGIESLTQVPVVAPPIVAPVLQAPLPLTPPDPTAPVNGELN